MATFAQMVLNGSLTGNLEVMPEIPMESFLRVRVNAYNVYEDIEADCKSDWYDWEVLRTVEMEECTRVILRVL